MYNNTMFIFKFLLFIFGFNMNIYRHKQAGFSPSDCATCDEDESETGAPYQTGCLEGETIWGTMQGGVSRLIAIDARVQLTDANIKQWLTSFASAPVANSNVTAVNSPSAIIRGLMWQAMCRVSRVEGGTPTANTKALDSGKDPVPTSFTSTMTFYTAWRDTTGEFSDIAGLNNLLKNYKCYHLISICCAELNQGYEIEFHQAGKWTPSGIEKTNPNAVGECKELGFGITRTDKCIVPSYCITTLDTLDGFWERFNEIPANRVPAEAENEVLRELNELYKEKDEENEN